MNLKDISTEEWREYDFPGGRVYRIDKPKSLAVGKTTHRVVTEDGTVHCVLFPGDGVVLRWKSFDTGKPVNF